MNDELKTLIKKAYILGFKTQVELLGAKPEEVEPLKKLASVNFDNQESQFNQKLEESKHFIRYVTSPSR